MSCKLRLGFCGFFIIQNVALLISSMAY
jgi:hypothetical protein